LDPVTVILFVARLGVALLTTGVGAAYVRGGTLAIVKTKTAMMSAILGEDLQWFFIVVEFQLWTRGAERCCREIFTLLLQCFSGEVLENLSEPERS
jgi:hypothetical protein